MRKFRRIMAACCAVGVLGVGLMAIAEPNDFPANLRDFMQLKLKSSEQILGGLALEDFDRIAKDVNLPDHGAKSLPADFKNVSGLPTDLVFGRQIFAMKTANLQIIFYA